MPSTLLSFRSWKKPIVWLLLVAMLPALSPHMAQGMVVLCIGDDHVAVETATGHHASTQDQESPERDPFSGGTDDSTISQLDPQSDLRLDPQLDPQLESVGQEPCTDILLHDSASVDVCHPAITAGGLSGDVLLPLQPVAALAADKASSAPSHISETLSSSLSLSPRTVVLLV